MNQFGSDSSLETPEMSTDLIDIISKSREIYGILDIWRCLMEKAMVPHSSTLATPVLLPSSWAEEPGRLQSMGSLRVGHDWGLHFHFSLSCIGEEMATHSSLLAWRIPWIEESCRLQSMGSFRVGHDWATKTFNTKIHDCAAGARLPLTLASQGPNSVSGVPGRLW